mgnify:CR=1 FL=1
MTPTLSHCRPFLRLAAALLLLGAGLSGCAEMGETISPAFADPAKYDLYDCKQLEAERKSLATRTAELQGLMAKAQTGVAGPVVAEVAYRNDYIATRGQAKLAEQAWQKNRCRETLPGEAMPVREATLMVALVNHPTLIDENFEHVEFLDLANGDLRRLHAALPDALAHDAADSREAVIAAIGRAGCDEVWERAVALTRKTRQWPALENTAIEDAREAFAQALHLHRSARTLHRELKQAEAALAGDFTEENYRHLVEVQAQFHDVQATEALIEGFGVSSGRAAKS